MFIEIQKVMSHSTRRRIVEYLSQGNATFSELQKHTDIKDHGKFGFHLRALRAVGIIEHDSSTKKYSLTEHGWVVLGLSSILKGITERKQVEERVTLLSRFIEQTSDPVAIVNLEGQYIYLNEAFEELRGYTREELMNRDFRETYSDTERDLKAKVFKEVMKSNFWIGELPYTHKDGSVVLAMVTSVLLKDGKGEPYAEAGIIRDITEQKKMVKALRESEERFKQVAENALEWIWDVDTNGTYTYTSPVVEKILGYTPEEIIGKKSFYDLFHPKDREELKKVAFATFSKKQPFREFINRNVHKNGNTVWLSTSAVPILDEEGNLLGYRGTDTDITKHKRMEEELKHYSENLEKIVEEKTEELLKSERKYRALYDTIKDGIAAVNIDGFYIETNQTFSDMLGYSKDDLKNLTYQQITPKLWHQREAAIVKEQIMKRGYSDEYEKEYIRKDGTVFPVSIRAWIMESEDGKTEEMWAIIRDITERKKIEENIKKVSEEWEKTFNAIFDFVFMLDKEYRFVRVNKALCDFLKKEPRELIGLHCFEVLHGTDKPWQSCPYKTLLTTKNVTTEEINDPHLGIPLLVSTSPLFDDKGEVAGCVHIAKDISERKRIEQQLLEAKRFATIGETAGMVSHDLRNPLQTIVNTIYLANKKLESLPDEALEKGDVKKYLDTVERQVGYMNKIISDLLDYARPIRPEPSETNISQLIQGTLLSMEIPEIVKVSIKVPEDLRLMIDPPLMRRVFTNLFTNAMQAMPDGGKLTITTSKTDKDALISVEDSGVGIPKENIDKIFQLLFTTKSKGQGFGLPVCKRIVDAHDGDITVKSKVGKGTTVTIKIPL